MELKQARATSTKTFLFINKDSSGLEINSGDSYSITAHVSRNHRKWLKGDRLRKLNASRISHRAGVEQHPINLKAVPEEDRGLPVPVTNVNQIPAQAQALCHSSDLSEGTSNQNRHIPPLEHPDGLLPAKLSCAEPSSSDEQTLAWTSSHELRLFKGNRDPFNASAIELDPLRCKAINSALQCFIFAAWPSYATTVFRARLGDENGSHIDLRRSIANGAELHAILAAGYLMQATNLGRTHLDESSNFRPQILVHKGLSIELLRKQLQTGTIPQNILTLVRLLISLDFNAGDFVSARVHLRGLRNVCRHDACMDDNLREVLRTSDVWIAMALLSKPDIDPEQHDPGVPSTQAWYRLLNTNQRQCFEHSQSSEDLANVLGTHLSRLLLAAKWVMSSKQVITMPGDPLASSQMVFWTSKKGSATTGGLMTRYAEERELAENAPNEISMVHHLRAASTLTFILYMNLHWMDTPINYDFSTTFQAIEPHLRQCSADVDQNCEAFKHTFIWLCFLCAMGDDIFAARGSLRFSGWAATEFLRLCQLLELLEGASVKAVLQKIAYKDNIMDDFLEVLLDSCHSSRKKTTALLPFSRWRRILDHYVPD